MAAFRLSRGVQQDDGSADSAQHRWLRRKLPTLTAVAAGALLTGTVVGRSSRWWAAELLANLPIHLALAAVLLLLVALLVRARLAAFLAVATLVANIAIVAPSALEARTGDLTAVELDTEVLEVTFFNTKITAADKDSTISYLAEREDDLIVLAGGYRGWVDELANADTPYRIIMGPHLPPGRDIELLVLTRSPTATARIHRPTEESRDAVVEVRLEFDGGPVVVLAANPVSPLTPERRDQRDRSLAWLTSRARDHTDSLVVMGDLNVSPWSPRFRELRRQGGLVDSQKGNGLQPSYPASLGPLGLPIDHVLHSTDLTAIRRSLGPSYGSDHRMVHASLARTASDR